ncbi:MAG: cobalamin biosynthesis protein, partial [Pseudonocardia sp.]|nr:cobalamin biosynthesis protein [Pseudonocardia sp.]
MALIIPGARTVRRVSRAVGLLLGFAADAVFGDPRRGHPVAGFGTLAAGLERRLYADRRSAGVVHTVVMVGGAVGLGLGLGAACRDPDLAVSRSGTRAGGRVLVTAAATWAVLGGSSLAGH